jgi:phosphoribosylglycinamide formyltransferase
MASGFGSNFQALIDGISTKKLSNSVIVSLVVNRKNAHATVRAEQAGVC